MALAIRESGTLKPDIRLAQAVSEFEALLTSEQKSTFRTSRDRAVSTAPTISDVMRLTAEIDLKATSKNGRGRCFGPRMTNTLQAVQQFAALGDIVVGGGQNLIACGVWAVARMTLHVITGYFTYLESLSLLFMAIGRNAPRYQAMAALYPKSKRLQGYLCEYFTIITSLCHQSVLWTRKSTIGRFTSTMNDPQMKTFKDDLEVWSAAIKEETNLLLNQKVAEEAKENSIFRSLATFRADAFTHQHKIERSTRLLDECSKYDYRTMWKQIRKCGTTGMLAHCQEYQRWKEASNKNSILFLGKLGAGKSVLLANIVDDLNLRDDAVTLYFFSRHDSQESLKARTIFGCLIRQLLEHVMNDSRFSHLFAETVLRLELKDIVALFRQARPGEVSIVVDGLDECERGVQDIVLSYLANIQKFGYKICLSVRAPESIHIWEAKYFDFRVYIPEENPDISDFIQAEVSSRVEDGRLVTRDPNLAEEVKKELIAGACGMFLWATLQLDSICAEVSDHDIREAIQDLPRDLTETFKRNLSRTSSQDSKKLYVRIFKLLVSARELLTADQLRQAASVTVGQKTWNSDKEITSIHPVLKFCGSLVMVDEEEDTVRFIHHSARSFCLSESDPVSDWRFTQVEADQFMAETMVTYLSCNVFETRLSKAVVHTMDAKEMPKMVVMTAMSAHHMGTSITNKLMSSKSKMKRDIGPTLAKVSASRSQGDQFPFLSYAKRHWLQHTSHLEDLPSLPQWYTLLDHPSFGIDHDDLPVRVFTPDPFLQSVDQLLRHAEVSKLRNRWRRSVMLKPLLSSIPPRWANMIWALSNGHILLLKHELTKSRGAQKIKTYVKLWTLLRRASLRGPSIILDLNYNLRRWLGRMFVNLAMDHPAKRDLLCWITEADDWHAGLTIRAVENHDTVSIRVLLSHNYAYENALSIMEWYDNDSGRIYRAAVPQLLVAAFSIPPETDLMESIIKHQPRWFVDLLPWFCFMDLSYFQWSIGQNPPLSFARAFNALRQVGVSEHRIRLLENLLDIARGRLVEIQGLEIVKVAELE